MSWFKKKDERLKEQFSNSLSAMRAVMDTNIQDARKRVSQVEEAVEVNLKALSDRLDNQAQSAVAISELHRGDAETHWKLFQEMQRVVDKLDTRLVHLDGCMGLYSDTVEKMKVEHNHLTDYVNDTRVDWYDEIERVDKDAQTLEQKVDNLILSNATSFEDVMNIIRVMKEDLKEMRADRDFWKESLIKIRDRDTEEFECINIRFRETESEQRQLRDAIAGTSQRVEVAISENRANIGDMVIGHSKQMQDINVNIIEIEDNVASLFESRDTLRDRMDNVCSHTDKMLDSMALMDNKVEELKEDIDLHKETLDDHAKSSDTLQDTLEGRLDVLEHQHAQTVGSIVRIENTALALEDKLKESLEDMHENFDNSLGEWAKKWENNHELTKDALVGLTALRAIAPVVDMEINRHYYEGEHQSLKAKGYRLAATREEPYVEVWVKP